MKIIGLIASSFCLIACVNLLKTKERELKLISVPHKDYQIRIIFSPSSATDQPSIQVKQVHEDKEVLMKDFVRYNFVETSYLQNDSTLLIVLKDTVSYLGNKPDTMVVKLP